MKNLVLWTAYTVLAMAFSFATIACQVLGVVIAVGGWAVALLMGRSVGNALLFIPFGILLNIAASVIIKPISLLFMEFSQAAGERVQ